MKFVTGYCTACGAEYQMPANSKAWHGQCPKKPTRGAAPQYLPRSDAAGSAGGSQAHAKGSTKPVERF